MKSSTKYLKVAINILLAFTVIIFCVCFLPGIIKFFLPFIIGWVISMIANPPVRFLEKHFKIIRKAGSAVVIVLVIGAVCLLGYVLISNLLTQLFGFVKTLPATWKLAEAELSVAGDRLFEYFDRLPPSFQLWISDFQENLADYGSSFFSKISEPTMTAAGNFAKNIPSILISAIMAIMSAYFFIAERDAILKFIDEHTSESIKKRYVLVVGSLRQAVGGYFKAQFKIMIIVAIILVVGLSILKINYAILLAFLIAFLDFLPFFGTGTVMVPWAIIRFLGGNYKAAIGLLIIWGVSQLVRQVIQPKIVGDSMGLPALPTLFLLYVGFKTGGAFGLIIAVPVGMIFYNLYKAGVFSNLIKSIRILVDDLNTFRKIEDTDFTGNEEKMAPEADCDKMRKKE